MELVLGPVERALLGRELERQLLLAEHLFERALGHVPLLVRADSLVRPRRQLDVDLLEAERPVDAVEELQEPIDLLAHLLRRAEDVGVVLREAPHAGHAVHYAAALVPVEAAEIGHPPRQLAVAAAAVLVHQAVARAVHRLLREVDERLQDLADLVRVAGLLRLEQLLDLRREALVREQLLEPVLARGEEHVVRVVRPVAALLEQALVENLWRDDLFVPFGAVQVAHVLDEPVVHVRALRQEEGHRRRVLVEHEELELLAELPVVPGLRLLELFQMRLERLLRRERRAVDAL